MEQSNPNQSSKWRRLGAWLAKHGWQRWHFMVSPFGIALTTLVVTHRQGFRPPIDHFDEMAQFASISAVFYGMFAVIAELLGGTIVFYTIMMANKAWRKIKEENRNRRIQLVLEDPDSVEEILEALGISNSHQHHDSNQAELPATATTGG